ncbi:MAG: response regulator [Alphaproteobacteria bacterium]|nr:response regulator [Alphaproteobacteria bacterium]
MVEKRKILVVEDNDFVRMQIVKFLNDAEYDTIEGTNGDEAMKLINREIDVAIVDLRMEPKDGFEFIRAIRADDIKTPVILVTGDQDPELLSEASKLGVSAVLMKPVQKDRLVKTVERTMRIVARAS